MRCNLSEKNILITGASSGIGRALALALAQRGNRVIAAGRSLPALQALAALLPGRLIPLVWDVSDGAQGERVREFVQSKFDWLDIAILNAGNCEYIERGIIDIDLVQRVMAVNFFGAVHSAQALLPLLRRAPQRPYLVCVSSMSTYVPLPRAEVYGASKAALRYFFESLRVDIGADVDISVVSPGFVKTPLTDRNDFSMPSMIDVDTAVRRILTGMQQRKLHIAFPRRLGWNLSLLGLLPQRLQLHIVRAVTQG
ncbi:MAG TPA: SDR family NAD(P)-dependent oxidoreductase [Spongiibacteraceae bacterium]|nr:SDR family NAD(P)-dependent oxidoreductase [Spongiibacteraceae bacterium]